MPTFVSPGGEGLPDTIINRRPRKKDFFSRRSLVTGASQVFRRTGTVVDVAVEIRGLNAVNDHFLALMHLLPEAIFWGLDEAAQLTQEYAKSIVAVDSGDTKSSIHYNHFTEGQGNIGVEIGPTTFYSPFLEFGTIKMNAQPFMIPAIDKIAPGWIAYNLELIRLANNFSLPSSPYNQNQGVRGSFSALRSLLYTTAKFLGDVQVIAGSPVIGGVRSGMYRMARGLGDMSAVMGGSVGSRISRRLTGRILGKGIGGSRASIFGGATYSSNVGGSAGSRIYSRVVGRQTKFIVTNAGVRG